MYYDANERLPLNNIFGEKIVKVYALIYYKKLYAKNACIQSLNRTNSDKECPRNLQRRENILYSLPDHLRWIRMMQCHRYRWPILVKYGLIPPGENTQNDIIYSSSSSWFSLTKTYYIWFLVSFKRGCTNCISKLSPKAPRISSCVFWCFAWIYFVYVPW